MKKYSQATRYHTDGRIAGLADKPRDPGSTPWLYRMDWLRGWDAGNKNLKAGATAGRTAQE